MHIALISSRFTPETSPGAKRVADLAKALWTAGHRTTILTQLPSYPDPAAFEDFLTNAERLTIDRDETGNEIWRFRPLLTAKTNFAMRLIGEARFAARTSKFGTHLADLDGVIASTPYMFNLLAARSYHLRVWFDLRDLTWEYVRGLGSGSMINRVAASCLKSLALGNFRAATRISTTTQRQRQYLIDHGIPEDDIEVVPNGVPRQVVDRLQQLSTAARQDGPLRVVYAGLLGLPQGLGFTVESMEGMAGDDIELHLYGDGGDREALIHYCQSRGLRHIHLHGHVSPDAYLQALASADILYAGLRPDSSLAAAMPSKIWEYMAAGKPILFAGTGEAPEAIERAQAGLSVRYGDKRDFQDKLKRLIADDAYRVECGKHGRDWIMRHQIRESINALWTASITDAFTR